MNKSHKKNLNELLEQQKELQKEKIDSVKVKMEKWKYFRVRKEKLICDYIDMKKKQFFAQTFLVMAKLLQLFQTLGHNYDEWLRLYNLKCRTLFVVMKIGHKFRWQQRAYCCLTQKHKNKIRYVLALRALVTQESKEDGAKSLLRDCTMRICGFHTMWEAFMTFG